jgi:3-deoxy-D-manno-octulosonic-acid transferase
MRRYLIVRELIAHTLVHADKILVQTPADADRFRALGAPAERVIVTGNTKFDLDDSPAPLRPALDNFARDRPVLLAGSTAPGEERMVLEAYRNLLGRFPNLALAVAPRHLDRVSAVEDDLRESGLPYVKASDETITLGNQNVLLIDTMGELRGFYYRAVIAFVGGSMNPPRGGQSMAEPAAAAIPILFGPHHENQRQIAEALLEAGGAVVVNDGGEIETQCAAWLANEPARRAAGQAARRVIEHLADGAAATVEHLRAMLETTIAPR